MRSLIALLFVLFLVACQSGLEESPTPAPIAKEIEPTSTIMPTQVVEQMTEEISEQPTESLPEPTEASAEEASPPIQSVTQRFDDLLAFLPATWADMHLPVQFGPTIYLLDIVQMREDLQIEPITGADSRQDKLDLILGMNTQGFLLSPTNAIDPKSGGMFLEWGWDIADVEQMMSLPDFQTSVYLGSFERTEIRERLLAKDYDSIVLEEYDYYTKEGELLEFAIKSDTLIMSTWEEESFIKAMLDLEPIASGLETHTAVAAILPELSEMWGVALSPSPDVMATFDSFAETLQTLPPDVQERFAGFEPKPLVWDFMGIAFKSHDDGTDLTVLYHYPSEQAAREDIEAAEISFVDTPTLSFRTVTWGELMMLKGVEVQNDLLIVQATTTVDNLIGQAIENRDAAVFLLLKQ